MDSTYWHRQAPGKPLHPELEWSRPETKQAAGKLLIVGGNAHAFAAPAEAYMEAAKSGIGVSRVVLPQRVRSLVGNILETVEYALSNPSGGFSQIALGDVLELAVWSDGVLLAGDFGRNSETAILLEKFLHAYHGQVTVTKDSLDYFTAAPLTLIARQATTLVLSFAQLQKLAVGAHFTSAFTFDMDFVRLVDALHEFTNVHNVHLITKHLDNIFVASGGAVCSTKLNQELPVWRVKAAAHASVWWLQNPAKSYEALCCAIAQLTAE